MVEADCSSLSAVDSFRGVAWAPVLKDARRYALFGRAAQQTLPRETKLISPFS
jgi:hypothetical protein